MVTKIEKETLFDLQKPKIKEVSEDKVMCDGHFERRNSPCAQVLEYFCRPQ